MAKRVFNSEDIEPKIKSFLGLNTVAREDTLEDGELRTATNVDIDNKNKLRMRNGSASVYEANACHSGWSDGVKAFFMEGGTLSQLSADMSVAAIKTGLQRDKAVSFLDVAGIVYYSNGTDKGRIENSVFAEWGIDQPTNLPAVSFVGGALHAGKYGMTITYVRADGSESGAPEAVFFENASSFGISLSGIPTIAEAAYVRIYLTAVNGDTFYLAEQIVAGVTSRVLTTAESTIPLRSYMVKPPPAGDILESYRARMYVAKGKFVYYSDPYSLEWFKPHLWFFRMTEDVTLLGAVENGMFISADKIYYVSFTDPKDTTIVTVAPYKAIKGTMVRIPGSVLDQNLGDKPVLLWRSEQGICLGSSDGQFLNLTESKYADNIEVLQGAGLFRQVDGMSQYISLAKKAGQNSAFSATDVASAEVVRNGILIT